jgi:SAM-dependent methyltransferase
MFANAESYECFMGRWSRLIAPLFDDFAGVLNPERVLDVGSGTGSLSTSIAAKHAQARVVGIDPAEEYVKYASRRNAIPDRVSFHVGDAHHLPFREATFQAGLSSLVFNFLPNPTRALNEMKRVTQPGGRVAAAVWDYGSGMQMLRLFWDSAVSLSPAAEKADEKHMPLCRRGELGGPWGHGGHIDLDEPPP